MLSEFLRIDLLGTIYIDEIFFFYEEPQVFTCTSKTGQKYIALLIDMDNPQWLLSPISYAQLSLLKSNRISLKESFIKSEDNYVWKVRYDKESPMAKAEQISSQSISDEDLPDDDLFLDWKQDKMLPVFEDNIIETSKNERRDVIDLSLEIADGHCREIGCEVLGEILTNTQQLIYSLAYKNDNIKGHIPKMIRDKNTLQVVGTFAASFGVRFKSSDLSNFFGETSVSQTLKILSNLLETKNNQEKLKEFLNTQSKRAVIKYRNLMKTLIQANAGLKVKLASPNEYFFNIAFSTNEIMNSLSILEGEINNMVTLEVMFGMLVGINVDKKTFMFIGVDGEQINGKLSDTLVNTTFLVPMQAEVEVEQRVTINDLIKEEKYTYTLLKINEIIPKSQ